METGRGNLHYKIPPTKKQKRRKRFRRFLIVFGVISVFIIVLHIALPAIIRSYLNKEMKKLPDYEGHIDFLSINMFTASASVKGITLKKKSGEVPVPFIDIEQVRFRIDWPALLKGRLVAFIIADHPVINVVKGPTEATTQMKVDKAWREFADRMIPLDINRLQVNDGEMHYRDYHSYPKVDVFLDEIYVLGENLSTVKDTSGILPATVLVSANAYGGMLGVSVRLDPLDTIPTFDLNAKLMNLPITHLNDLLRAYAKLDVQKGTFSVYTELAARNGRLTGYAKPFIKDLDVIDKKERKHMSQKQQRKESLVEFVAWIFKDKEHDRLATKININGSISRPDISLWGVIGEALINAFMQSLVPTIENTINISTVGKEPKKNFLQRLFEPDKDKPKKKKHKKHKN